MTDCQTIETSAEQDAAMQSTIDARTENPGTYNVLGRNCSLFVFDVLDAGGLYFDRVAEPRSAYGEIFPSGNQTRRGNR